MPLHWRNQFHYAALARTRKHNMATTSDCVGIRKDSTEHGNYVGERK